VAKTGFKPTNPKMFSSEYQPKNNGRKPSKLKKYIKDNNVGKEDVALMIKNVLFTYSQQQLEELLKDKEAPMLMRLLVRAFLEDFKKGALSNFTTMMDRAYGSAKQEVEVNSNTTIFDMTPEQRRAAINEYLEKRNPSNVQGSGSATDRPAAGVPGQAEKDQQEKS